MVGNVHLVFDRKFASEINSAARRFNGNDYSKIEEIDRLLLRRDISVEKKKKLLLAKLHSAVITAFSIDKKKFTKKSFEAFKKRLHAIRKVTIKLRSINYYLETSFLEDMKLSRISLNDKKPKLKRSRSLMRDELEALEYTTYRLIEEAVILDKKLLREYGKKEKSAAAKEKSGFRDLNEILLRESELLEHFEAKMPPARAAGMSLFKEPVFSHWAARVFAILSRIESLCAHEKEIFGKLKRDKALKARIDKKITAIVKEKSELVRLLGEKAASMNAEGEVRKELHNLTTAISI